ncbi:porin [Acetobacter sp. AN02]|uniref:outer membrane beta-barrel protein n=1 Tax=Acetobacter sp. AN02 TaxID=2894186 RepID=UPI002434455E|nr:outer membrane beta-barrel protein [Acetobacter sp. AN02]MDG6094804.1 porin [Acetobacter sp. AN02]
MNGITLKRILQPLRSAVFKVSATLSVAGFSCISPASAQVSIFHNDAKTGIGSWLNDVTLKGQIEGGITANPARPADGINYGNFFGDHANQVQLDQVYLTLSRDIDPAKSDWQIGFNLQALYGSDARYYHLLGISDRMTSDRYQFIPAQAHIDVHAPIITKGGLDMQAGILQAPMGREGMDPMSRQFYTLAYTSEYAVPFEHVGAMFNLHVDDRYDVLFGLDTGNQTTFGRRDNNDEPAAYFGLNIHHLLHDKLDITYLGRVGPENSIRALGHRANTAQRFWNDLSAAYKISDKVTLTGEFNFLHDEGLRAETYSFVSFLTWDVSPSFSFNYRGEIFRDNTGLMVASFLDNRSYMNAIAGKTSYAVSAPPTTYGALTLGVSYHPDLGHHIRTFAIRPEIRFDRSLNGTSPFNAGRNTGMFTFGGDAVLGF